MRASESAADPAEVAGLASTRTFPLRSSFAPTYNMTINLVNQMGPEQAHELHEHIVNLTRDTLFGISRPGQSEAVRAKAMGLSLDAFARTLYSDPEFRNARYYDGQTTAQWVPDDDATTPPEVREQRERKRRNTRGVRGLTNSSGMVDVYKHTAFIKVHRAIHRRLMAELGLSKLFFGPERCGLRAHLSAELPPHQDEPLVVGDVGSDVVAGGGEAGGPRARGNAPAARACVREQ